MLAQQNSNDPACLQTYFYDAEFQAKYRALKSARSSIRQTELLRRERIFRLLHDILVNDCNNSYLQSFLSINELIRSRNVRPKTLCIEFHVTHKPEQGHHPGCYNLPTAPEVSLDQCKSSARISSDHHLLCSNRRRQ